MRDFQEELFLSSFNGKKPKSTAMKMSNQAARLKAADAARPYQGLVKASKSIAIRITNANTADGDIALIPSVDILETENGHILSGKFTNGEAATVVNANSSFGTQQLKRLYRTCVNAPLVLQSIDLTSTKPNDQFATQLVTRRISDVTIQPAEGSILLQDYVDPKNVNSNYLKRIPVNMSFDNYNQLLLTVIAGSTATVSFRFGGMIVNAADDLQRALSAA